MRLLIITHFFITRGKRESITNRRANISEERIRVRLFFTKLAVGIFQLGKKNSNEEIK
jgi:hypothetical protein